MKRYDYMSPEWAAEVKKQLQADLPAEKMKFITTSMSNIYTNCPDVIDAARVADDSWLDEDYILGYAPMGGMDQVSLVADFIREELGVKKGRIGVENNLSNYLPVP